MFASEEESIPFNATIDQRPLKLRGDGTGRSITQSSRFSILGGPSDSDNDARSAAEDVCVALWLWSVNHQQGIDLGQHSLKSFAMSDEWQQHRARTLGVDQVLPDHLGVTVFRSEPRTNFERMDIRGTGIRQAAAVVDEWAKSIGRCQFTSKRALLAAQLYGSSHFVGLTPARFLMMFVALESLFVRRRRSAKGMAHVEQLMRWTDTADVEQGEREAIRKNLERIKTESIRETGRKLARQLSPAQYDSCDPDVFFKNLYEVRNTMVHSGKVDNAMLQQIVGEMDRFVTDILKLHFIDVR